MSSEISFLPGTYSLIHIPLRLYPFFLRHILAVLLPETPCRDPLPAGPAGLATPDSQHVFLNVSVTPIECSVVCHSAWAERVFGFGSGDPGSALEGLSAEDRRAVIAAAGSYLILSVDSAGEDPAGRVLALSAPLSEAGIPIFFIATYFSDFILVPAGDRARAVTELVGRGFAYRDETAAAAAPAKTYAPLQSHPAPAPGPPASGSRLAAATQGRVFQRLRDMGIETQRESGLQLVQCAGQQLMPLGPEFGHGPHYHHHHDNSSNHNSNTHGQIQAHDLGFGDAFHQSPHLHRAPSHGHAGDGRGAAGPGAGRRFVCRGRVDADLYLAMVSALASRPRFFSVTLAEEDPPSMLMDQRLYGLFGDYVVADTQHVFVPLMLDLARLPFEATGIVCGVAGRLASEMNLSGPAQLSYLSTAKGATVILSHDQANQAMEIMGRLLGEVAVLVSPSIADGDRDGGQDGGGAGLTS